jgi:hypothetical protein
MAIRLTPVERHGRRRSGAARKHLTFFVSGAQTTGTAKLTFRMPEAGRYVGTTVKLETVNTGATFIVDVNKAGTTLYTTQARRPTIADGAASKTSTESAPANVTALAAGDTITLDVDQIGSTVAGTGLSVTFTYDA